MATKKKTKAKASKSKTTKTATKASKAAKSSKVKKAAKPQAKKKTSPKGKVATKTAAKKAGASGKKKKVTAAKAPKAKKTTAAKAPKKAAAPKVKAAGLKEKVRRASDSKKPSKKPVAQKPAENEIEEVLAVELPAEVTPTQVEEVVLTDSEGRRYCRVKDCDQLATVDAYCRYHYLLFWKKIQIRKKILAEGKLEKYIEELTARYPDKYLDMLRKDLRSEKEFLAAIQELEIDDSNDENMDEEDSQSFIEEVRGISETSGSRDDDY